MRNLPSKPLAAGQDMKGRTTQNRQQGAASIEFAFMFVLVFMVFYGMVGYFFPLLLSASYHQLSSEALRHVVSLQYASLDETALKAEARRVIEESWLPEIWARPCGGMYGDGFLHAPPGADNWSTCVRHDSPSSILMPITLFGVDLLPLPEEIRGEAKIRLH